MAATTAAAAGLNMKLLVDTKAQRMLFAEASKDVVDFLFSLLALPVGTAVKLLGEESMVGCVGNLHASVGVLDDAYVLSGASRNSLLRPPWPRRRPSPAAPSSACRRPAPPQHRPVQTNSSDPAGEVQFLPSAGSRQPAEQEESPRGGGGDDGFVQAVVTYTVMDDLTVKPMSAVTSITLLTTFAVADLAALQERTVRIGHAEALGILKASLQSKTVLTDVFLNKKAAPGDA
ncbi:uncharacterized protein LOC120709621 [Panicum virgatum]|uniref:uncharacterized protein LOC120709621 n=1 Tax=Panicum virgatum TaxID=38727 RepID=UPI0019D63284|nr:uncharacterized protein LOC120709621 [Panicum virgatum]